MQAVGVQHLVIHGLGIEANARGTQGDDQSLGGGFFVKFVRRQLRFFPFQTVAGLGQSAAGVLGVGIQGAADIVRVQVQIGQQSNDVLLGAGSGIGLLLLRLGSRAAVVVGGFHGGFGVQRGFGVLGTQAQLGAGQVDDHVGFAEGLAGGLLHGADGLAFGHAADVDIGEIYVVQNFVVIGVRGAEQENGHHADQQHQYQGACRSQNQLLVFIEEGHGLIQPIGIGRLLVVIQEFPAFQIRLLREQVKKLRIGVLGKGPPGRGRGLLASDLAECLFDLPFLVPVRPGSGKFTLCHKNLLIYHSGNDIQRYPVV